MKFFDDETSKKIKAFQPLMTYQTERILLGFIRVIKVLRKDNLKPIFNQKLAEQALSSVIIRFS
jgi:hypothetical protein